MTRTVTATLGDLIAAAHDLAYATTGNESAANDLAAVVLAKVLDRQRSRSLDKWLQRSRRVRQAAGAPRLRLA